MDKFIETESRFEVNWAGEGEMDSYCFMATAFLFGIMYKFWRWSVVMVTQHCECT